VSNPVCRASLDFGAKRGCTGAVVYSDGFLTKRSRVPWDAWDRWDRLFPLLSIGRIKHFSDLSLHFSYALGRKTCPMRPMRPKLRALKLFHGSSGHRQICLAGIPVFSSVWRTILW